MNKIIANEALLSEVCGLLAKRKQVRLAAKGNSMRPFINGATDVLVLAPAGGSLPSSPGGSLRRGDIVLARLDGGHYVVHRIMRRDGDTVLLMGDGNLAARERCSVADVKGRVVEIIRGGKRLDPLAPAMRAGAGLWMWLLPVRRFLLPLVAKRHSS